MTLITRMGRGTPPNDVSAAVGLGGGADAPAAAGGTGPEAAEVTGGASPRAVSPSPRTRLSQCLAPLAAPAFRLAAQAASAVRVCCVPACKLSDLNPSRSSASLASLRCPCAGADELLGGASFAGTLSTRRLGDASFPGTLSTCRGQARQKPFVGMRVWGAAYVSVT
uniref:Uncharacterized protein n=1 Tax=Chlamydomonas euryale TaxID=1486919 RepID=A0A7R9V5P7_9CHLO